MSDVPSSYNPVQQEALQFNQPVSESSLDSIASLANGIRYIALPVGSVTASILTESQFQAQTASPAPQTWILCDGRDVEGTLFSQVTGLTNVPDMRGLFIRGKNNGRSDGDQNPDGELALGQFSGQRFGAHNHAFNDPGHSHSMNPDFGDAGTNYNSGNNRQAYAASPFGTGAHTATSSTGISIQVQGGNDTAPANLTLNWFIRIN